MKLFLSLMLLCATVASQAQTTIYAYRNWQPSNPTSSVKGPVKFSSDNPGQLSLIADQSRLGNVYAAAYYNYKWYAQVTVSGMQSSVEGLYTIDMNTGERTLIANAGSQLTEMAYDYTTDVMYAIAYGAEELATIDIKTGEVTTIARFSGTSANDIYMLALACDLDGKLYGIGTDDNLYLIDKKNATCSLIGSTGVNAAYTQSMEFDHNNHILYWINCGDYKLYTVDINTGKATEIGGMGETGDDSLSGMAIPYINVPTGSPDRVTDRSASAAENAITLQWTNPQHDAQGNTLTGLNGVKIFRNGEYIATVDLTAGDIGKISTYNDAGLDDGMYTYRVIPFNDNGDGGVDSDDISVYIGDNAPGQVQSFEVKQGDNSAIISWEAPEKGLNNGDFDPGSITKYVITRSTGASSTEIEINDPTERQYIDTPGFGTYTYSIYAVNNVGNGAVTTASPIIVKPSNWIIMHNGRDVIDNDTRYKFYDNAGPNAYYSNSLNDTLTIIPKYNTGYVKIEFKSFYLDTYGDTLSIYNGSNTEAALIGKYSSETVPSDLAQLEASNADGALTFIFKSDIMSRYEGWEADVSVIEKLADDIEIISLTGNAYPEANHECTFLLSFINKGKNNISGSDYTLKLMNDNNEILAQTHGIDLSTMQSASVELKFTPTSAGNMNIYAEAEYDSDDDKSNDTSESLAITVLEEGSTFSTIGAHDSELYVVPASFMSSESICETIYFKDEINVDKGYLKLISFPLASATTSYADVPIKVWVHETDLDELIDAPIPANDMTLVFDGNCPIKAGDTEWNISLPETYEYNGGNLAIMVYKQYSNTVSSGVSFVGTYGTYSVDKKRSRYDSTWDNSERLDPNSIFGYSASEMYADVKLLFLPNPSSVTSIGEDAPEVSIYPNPATSIIYINGNVRNVELTNMAGQLILSGGENTNEINVENVTNGIYILKITTTDNKHMIKKIIIQ